MKVVYEVLRDGVERSKPLKKKSLTLIQFPYKQRCGLPHRDTRGTPGVGQKAGAESEGSGSN